MSLYSRLVQIEALNRLLRFPVYFLLHDVEHFVAILSLAFGAGN